MMFLLLLVACEDFSVEQYLRDVRTTTDQIRWEGFVYRVDAMTGDSLGVQDGRLSLTDLEETWSIEAEQPYTSNQSWWRFTEVPKETEVVFRVEADDHVPMIWRARSPTGNSRWLDFGLYTSSTESVDTYTEELSALLDFVPQPLAENEIAHLWGSTWSPEEWIDAELRVFDDAGNEYPVLRLRFDDETGSLVETQPGEPIELFYAFDLLPGRTTLEITTCEGVELDIEWPTQSGDLLSALYTTLPQVP